MGKIIFLKPLYVKPYPLYVVAYHNLNNRIIKNNFCGTFKLLNKRPRTRKNRISVV